MLRAGFAQSLIFLSLIVRVLARHAFCSGAASNAMQVAIVCLFSPWWLDRMRIAAPPPPGSMRQAHACGASCRAGALSGSGITAGLEYGMPPPAVAAAQGGGPFAVAPAPAPASAPAADMSWLLAGGGPYSPPTEPSAPAPPRHVAPALAQNSPLQQERRNSIGSAGRRVSFDLPAETAADIGSRPNSREGHRFAPRLPPYFLDVCQCHPWIHDMT